MPSPRPSLTQRSRRNPRRGLATAAATGLALSLLATPVSASPVSAADGVVEKRGDLPGGGRYVLYEPAHWTGTVLVWSPGYGGSGAAKATAAPSPAVQDWLLDQGYALLGTTASQGGWSVEDLVANQPDALNVVRAELGEPRDVIAWGSSMGGLTSAANMEAHPEIFDAALPLCGSVAGGVPMLNGSLDGSFVLKMLLAPDDERLELVNVQNEAARQAAFREVLEEAQTTPQGRARIALAASVAQVPAWTQPSDPQPAPGDLAAQQEQLYAAFMFGVVSPRQPLEQRAGGNFSWNTGVDYSRFLAHSDNAALVRGLYAEAGLSLSEDLEALAAAERISPDSGAVAYMQSTSTPTGDLSGPVLTLHETGDTAPTVSHAGTYADRVRTNGDNALLRQAFVDRPGHCDYADAEIAAMVTTIQERLDTGRWANLAHPASLNALADQIATADGLERGGSFTQYTPDSMLRPEREEQQ
jgi:hypothetical protein